MQPTPQDGSDALARAPALTALAHSPAPAFALDALGAVVWTNAAGRPLAGDHALDAAGRRALERVAAVGAEGLARVKVNARDGAAFVTLRSRRLTVGGRLTLFEALAPIDFGEQPEQPPAVSQSEAPDVAAADLSSPAFAPAAFSGPAVEPASPPVSPAAPRDLRFVFEIDADGRISFLSPDLGEAVGPSAAASLGRTWGDVAADLGLDPTGAIADRISRPGVWSDAAISWPLENGGRLPILLSALPMFDRGRTFVGFRGLGRSVDEEPADERPPVAPILAPDAAAEDAPGPAVEEGQASPDPRLDVVASPEEVAADRPELEAASATPDLDASADVTPETEPVPPETRAAAAVAPPPEPAAVEPHRPQPEIADPWAAMDPIVAAILRAETPTPPAPADADDAPHEIAARGDIEPESGAKRYEPPSIISAPPHVEVHHGNVVPLREALSPGVGVSLSSVEEDAFDEIARRLRNGGARPPAVLPPAAPQSLSPDDAERSAIPEDAAGWTPYAADGPAPAASRLEEALRLIDRLPIGALVLQVGRIAHANRVALDMTGHPNLASLVEHGASELFAAPLPRDDAAPAALRLIAKDGVEVEVEAKISAVSWDGAPATLVSLKRAEANAAGVSGALRREREIGEILDTATDGVMTLDSAGRILSVNRSAEALFGFEGADVVGRPFTLSLAPESRRVAFDYLDSLKSNGVASVMNDGREVLGLARQGGAIPLYLTIGRIGQPEGGRYCAVLRDITHWKRAEEELLAAKRQAERANAQKSEFLGRVGHEIRTPLNAIIGFAEVMMEERFGPIGNVRYRDYVRDIHASGGHLIALVTDLLDLSRVESGALNLDFAPVDLNEVVSQAAALLQGQANRDHVIIRTSLARNLPPVMADRRTLRQILANLVGSAMKASRPGGQVIAATAFTDAGQAVIRVRDAGAGMSKKDLARAMEPFRALAAEDADAANGVGLPLTKALTEANEAQFAMHSEIGSGTLVEITFPAIRVLTN